MKSYYELLGASADDDAEALKKAFRKAVKAHHPDLRPNDPDALERFTEIIAANTTLRDAKQRATYDWFLQLDRESFQLMLKRQQFPLKRMRTIAVIAAVTALIGGYGLRTTMPTSGKVEIDKDELAAAAGAAVHKQTTTVVAAVKEINPISSNTPTATSRARPSCPSAVNRAIARTNISSFRRTGSIDG